MALNKAIQFRHLITQLTHQERIQFLSKLVGSHLDIILTSLFRYLLKSNQLDEVNEFNKELSDIIQSRKDKPAPLCTRNIKLDEFPRAIIGYSASFLDQLDYINFSLSNRSTYLGCNSPNTLQELNLKDILDYSAINLTSFPSIRCLHIDPFKTAQSQQRFSVAIDDASIFNQISELRLNAKEKTGWVQPFLDQNIVNCDNITALECKRFGSWTSRPGAKMQGDEFLALLTTFPRLTHLQMNGVRITGGITAQDIADVCPKVVGLAVTTADQATVPTHLPRTLASQLKYLSLRQGKKKCFDCDNIAFDKLEELRLWWPDNQSLNAILKSALNLKKVHIKYWEHWMTNDEIQNSIADLISKSTFLRYAGFSITSPRFGDVLEGIEHGLFKIKTQHRTELKLSIMIRNSEWQPNDFTFKVARVINSLETCDIDDFMFIWEFKGHNDDKSKLLLDDLRNISKHSKVFQYQYDDKSQFIITNRNCKINGYQTSFVLGNKI
eukprot:558027_1